MRLVMLAVAVSLAFSTAAVEPTVKDRERGRDVHRHPSEWNIDDRLTERFAPESIAERTSPAALRDWGIEVDAPKAMRDEMTALANVGGRVNIIVGARNPELFLPWELFNHLMNTVTLPEEDARDYCRRNYLERADSLDVPPDFWSRLEKATVAFRTAIDAKRKMEMAGFTREMETREMELCSARATALRNARAEFGGAWFDRFLYTAVTPSIIIRATDETADEHRWIEGGCR